MKFCLLFALILLSGCAFQTAITPLSTVSKAEVSKAFAERDAVLVRLTKAIEELQKEKKK